MMGTEPGRIRIACLPTPIQELHRLSRHLGGPSISMKRDDQTGLAFGGNKTRKLEFLMAEAQAQNADTVITGGAIQSNHCRQTAAAAAMLGMDCIIELGGECPAEHTGNHFISTLLGAEIRWNPTGRKGETLRDIKQSCLLEGKRPYVIPYGGSNPVGAYGYVFAMRELRDQLQNQMLNFDYIVFASSSGGTQAGMMVGARIYGIECSIVGIDVDKRSGDDLPYPRRLADLSNEIARTLDTDLSFSAGDFDVHSEYAGKGYAIVGERERDAIHLLARLEGILLDPVYTSKAMGGLVDLIETGAFRTKDRILFWHTGGAPALFAYTRDLS